MSVEKGSVIEGVCPLIFYSEDPKRILVVRELKTKELSGKIKGQWGPGFETVEPEETHSEAINRFFHEEVKVKAGHVFIPEDLQSAKLCEIRVSPSGFVPEAWVHVYPTPVSDNFVAEQGAFLDEVNAPLWVDIDKILNAAYTHNGIIFRTGTYEIAERHMRRLEDPNYYSEVISDPVNMPPTGIFRLLEQGVNQIEALSRYFAHPELLEDSAVLSHL